MLQFRSAHGAILAWRQATGAPITPPDTGTYRPRRGWYALARGLGRVSWPLIAGTSVTPPPAEATSVENVTLRSLAHNTHRRM